MIIRIFSVTFLVTMVSLLQAETKKVDFMTEVKPIFEATCIGCHYADKDKGGYRMDTKELAFAGGDEFDGEVIIPKNAEDSAVYWMTTLPSLSLIHISEPTRPY